LTTHPENPVDASLGQVLDVYVPLKWTSGAPQGTIEVYLHYEPHAGLVTLIRNSIWLAGAVVALGATVALFLLYRAELHGVRRERDVAAQREREVIALNRVLQRDVAHSLELREGLRSLRDQLASMHKGQLTKASPAEGFVQMEDRIGKLATLSVGVLARDPQPGGNTGSPWSLASPLLGRAPGRRAPSQTPSPPEERPRSPPTHGPAGRSL
jgi:hypothetical protein